MFFDSSQIYSTCPYTTPLEGGPYLYEDLSLSVRQYIKGRQRSLIFDLYEHDVFKNIYVR